MLAIVSIAKTIEPILRYFLLICIMNVLNYKITTVLLAILIVWVGIRAWTVHTQQSGADLQVVDMERKIDALQKENEKLQRLADYYKSSTYLEKQARLKLNYKAPDEQVVFVYQKQASVQTEIPVPVLASKSFFARLWEYFFGR